MQPGDKAPYAHQNVREFPDWYKPYGFNYQSEGWALFIFGGICVLGWSYLRDIKEQKGRKTRKIYSLLRTDGSVKPFGDNFQFKWAKDRLEKEDPNWVKFTIKKERAAAHH